MTKLCPRCRNLHDGQFRKCDYCLVADGKYAVQSQSEVEWADHVEDYKHQDDYLTDGRCSEP